MRTYRYGKSSEQMLLYTIDKILLINALDQHLIVSAAFLNLRKAFDLLDHVILYIATTRMFGCPWC